MGDTAPKEEKYHNRIQVVTSQTSAVNPPSPFRGSRFERQTRREAIERRFGKLGPKNFSGDEKKDEDAVPVHVSSPSEDATPLVSNKTLKHRIIASPISSVGKIRGRKIEVAEHSSSAAKKYFSSPNVLDHDIRSCETDTKSIATSSPQHLQERTIEKHYYRVVYRGVVSLLSSPDSNAAKSGSYLSYGEIFQSRWVQELGARKEGTSISPRRSPVQVGLTSPQRASSDSISTGNKMDLPTLPNLPSTDSDVDSRGRRLEVIRVDKIITGGYSIESSGTKDTEVPPGDADPEKEACSLKSPMKEGLGYLFSQHGEHAIVERLSNAPEMEEGSFLYRVVSTSPIPILLGPSLDAPKTKAMALPGTMHDVSLRLKLDSDKNGVTFLRLSHRRGWIADRMINSRGDFVPAVKEVERCGKFIDDCDASVLSSVSTLSITTSASLTRRRHRPPRRRVDASRDVLPKSHPGVNSVTFPTIMPKKTSSTNLVNEACPPKCVTSPGSNVSILSDEDSLLDQTTMHNREANSSTVNASFTATKSAGSVCSAHSFYLMRVTAPRGLKILDAPHFQVSHLIHGNTGKPNVSSSHLVSQFESGPPKTHHSIFQTMSGRLTTTGPSSRTGNPAVFDKGSKSRILPRGVLFEASRRMENTGAFNQGAGLIKLSDNSGWAIVPRKDELDDQYRSFHGLAGVREGEAMRAYEEVGEAMIDGSGSDVSNSVRSSGVWIRVLARSGLVVSCPPPSTSAATNDGDTSPSSSRESSTVSGSNTGSGFALFPGNDSDVASSVGSAFLDAMFRTPKKKKRDGEASEVASRAASHLDKTLAGESIACGMCVEVEKWGHSSSEDQRSLDYARLRGGQGWIPLTLGGKVVSCEVHKPEFRFGSFWFRVQSTRGIKVRLGPSRKAPSIKSEDGIYFRFECGEFLRASEVLTVFSEDGKPSECFAKLYRNRHVQLYRGHEEFRQLASLTAPAEWVQVYGHDDLFLKEGCDEPPTIERHRQGWRYNVVPDSGVAIRKGPSFASEMTGTILFGGESLVVIERVSAGGEEVTWLRLKDGQGWVHDLDDEGNQIMIPHLLRHRAHMLSRPKKPRPPHDGKEIAYNTIVARLFHNDDPRPSLHPSDSATNHELGR